MIYFECCCKDATPKKTGCTNPGKLVTFYSVLKRFLDLDPKIYKRNNENGGFKEKFIISFYKFL